MTTFSRAKALAFGLVSAAVLIGSCGIAQAQVIVETDERAPDSSSAQGIQSNFGGLSASGRDITGWAFSLQNPTSTLRVELSTDSGSGKTLVTSILTLAEAPSVNRDFNITGTHRFRYEFPDSYCGTNLNWYADVVRSNGSRTPLTNSPRRIQIPACTPSQLPTVSVIADDAIAVEGEQNSGRFTVSRTGATTESLTVTTSVSGSANASDYAPNLETITIPAGQASASLTISPIYDANSEPAETVILTIAPQSSYTVGAPASASILITDGSFSGAPAVVCRSMNPGTPPPIGYFKCLGELILPRHIASTTATLARIDAMTALTQQERQQLSAERERILQGVTQYLNTIRTSSTYADVRMAWYNANWNYEAVVLFVPKIAIAERGHRTLVVANNILDYGTRLRQRIEALPENHGSRARLLELHGQIVSRTEAARSSVVQNVGRVVALVPAGSDAARKQSNRDTRTAASVAITAALQELRSVRSSLMPEAERLLQVDAGIACALNAPTSVEAGRRMVLAWNTSGAPSQGSIALQGTVIVSSANLPSGSATTTAPLSVGMHRYQMQVSRAGLTASCFKDVRVTAAPPVSVAPPVAAPVGGTYRTPQQVTLTSQRSESIRYTTDGTQPTCDSGQTYERPISIAANTVLKAIGCAGSARSTVVSQTYRVLTPPNDFGFFMVDTGTDDPNDDTNQTDFLLEVKPFSTVAGGGGAIRNPASSLVDNLKKFKAQGVRPIVSVSRLMFLGPETYLRADYKSLIDAFVKNNEGYLTTEYIKAFYVVDEPYWVFDNETKVGVCGTERALSYQEFAEGTAYLEEKVPGVPQYFSESHNCVSMMQIPPSIDYVSFHRYAMMDPSADEAYRANLNTLLSKLSSTQKLWMIMDAAYSPPRYSRANIRPQDMGTVAANFWKVACSDEYAGKIDTIYAYRWPADSSEAADGSLGARDFSARVKGVYQQIYDRIQADSCAAVAP